MMEQIRKLIKRSARRRFYAGSLVDLLGQVFNHVLMGEWSAYRKTATPHS